MKDKTSFDSQPGFIMQDGCHCPEHPPWHPTVSKVTALPILFFFGVGGVGMALIGLTPFLVWLIIAGIKVYAIRYFVCARCPYYGKNCSSFFGKLTALIHKKQENKSMVVGLWVDTLFWGIIFFYPLYHFIVNKMYVFSFLYSLSYLVMVIVLTRLACAICPLTVCPVGKMARLSWRMLGIERKGQRQTMSHR